ncbi:hypothetical protein MOX02_17590 [Methylobacterium oxalidis]|uniref:Uncharacterized protein n=3 Tax=Methylobacterium TaxID=407 RepID=A0A512J178_9HYPH|nr:hypothetical protein MOX02_17590 [Methylobacterium oxalidis]GJE00662.1 hypothetical protein GMJLKIPL_2586 [Methylobacterium isbiliense]GLS62305.1 hypothetical protein GCM10007888_06860 [Methylobacterium oxalidis]
MVGICTAGDLDPCVPGEHHSGMSEAALSPARKRTPGHRAIIEQMAADERRREDAERKRKERADRKAAGLPDPRELDRAIVDAIRDAPLTGSQGARGRTHPNAVHVEGLVRRAARALQLRGYLPAATVPALFARISRDTVA